MLWRTMGDLSQADPSADSNPATSKPLILMMVATTAAWTVSLMSYYAQAQLLGPIMEEYARGEGSVGWLFSLENAALALSTLAAAGPLARWSRKGTALLGGTVVAVANIVAAFAGSYETLLLTRVLVGIGAGLVGASGTAAAAASRDPQRVYAVVTVAWGLLGAAEPTLLAYVIEPFGTRGGFMLLAGLGVLLMPTFVWLLPPRESSEERATLLSAPNRGLALIMMFGLLVFETGQGGIYTFVAQIGENVGLDAYEVGNSMTGSGLAGLVGGVIAAALGERLGLKWPIVIGIALNAIAAAGIALGSDASMYVGLLVLWNAAYYFVIPYLMGAMAELDDRGRWVVASDGAWTLGDALGPGLAGTLVERSGYTTLAMLSMLAAAVCIVAALIVMRRYESTVASPIVKAVDETGE